MGGGNGYNMLFYQEMRKSNIEDWYIDLYEDQIKKIGILIYMKRS